MKLLELAALLKPNYAADWYHALLADLLQRCAGGDPDVPNLLISTPPGSGKTELIGILFPTYIFAHDRDAHVIALANSDSLACLASRNVLGLVQHPEFQERWPLALDKASASQWTVHGNHDRFPAGLQRFMACDRARARDWGRNGSAGVRQKPSSGEPRKCL